MAFPCEITFTNEAMEMNQTNCKCRSHCLQRARKTISQVWTAYVTVIEKKKKKKNVNFETLPHSSYLKKKKKKGTFIFFVSFSES